MKASGRAIAIAMIEMFDSDVYFRIALKEIARARVTTRKNQVRMTNFHLYFIRVKIMAKARAKENMIDRNDGVGSVSGASSPNGRLFIGDVVSSPVVGSMIFIGE